ncbi:MAG: serine/threonine protein kinase [Blautia sp.]|nr:serine/threonine protein kinase [Blautia sp.]
MDNNRPFSGWQEWKITEKIGEGSYGKVYKARRTEQGRSFLSAIKVISIPTSRGELDSIRQETGNDASLRQYFHGLVDECIHEICTMEYFRGNSHIVSVEDFKVIEYLDEVGWDIFIRMEYLTSFLDYCTAHAPTERNIIKLGIDICKALEYCGHLSIIHRDIKPENIFVSRFGDFKIGDFGIARKLELSGANLSKKGTYSYMAPEMYRGEIYDSSVDIYSLGIVLYKLMNKNRLPFISLDKQLITHHDKENALNKRMAGEKLPPPVDASPELGRIIMKACAFHVRDRYQYPEALREDLERLRRGDYSLAVLSQNNRRPLPPEQVSPKALPEGSSQNTGYSHVQPEKQKKERRFSHQPIWLTLLLITAAAACTVSGIYVKLLYDGYRRVISPGSAVIALHSNASSTAQVDDFSTALQTVLRQTNAIVARLPDCTEEGSQGERLRYFDSNGNLLKVLVYPSYSESGMYEEYYYWRGQVFFIYYWNDTQEELYYFDSSGKLLRWIDTSGKIHDRSLTDPDFAATGNRLTQVALDQME